MSYPSSYLLAVIYNGINFKDNRITEDFMLTANDIRKIHQYSFPL